jgi:hypothetical protein
LGALLVVTTLFSVFFGFLKLLEAPPVVGGAISLFLFLVALGQIFLFQGQQPRQASVATGAVLGVTIPFCFAIYYMLGGPLLFGMFFVVMAFTVTLPFGAVCGYVAGAIVAGVFLMIDAAERRLTKTNPVVPVPQAAEGRDFEASNSASGIPVS